MIDIQTVWNDCSILNNKYLKFKTKYEVKYWSPACFKEDTVAKKEYAENPDFCLFSKGTSDFKTIIGHSIEIAIYDDQKYSVRNNACNCLILSKYSDEREITCYPYIAIEEISKEEFDKILNQACKLFKNYDLV